MERRLERRGKGILPSSKRKTKKIVLLFVCFFLNSFLLSSHHPPFSSLQASGPMHTEEGRGLQGRHFISRGQLFSLFFFPSFEPNTGE